MRISEHKNRIRMPKSRAGKVIFLALLNIFLIFISAYLLVQPSILRTELAQIQGSTNYDTIVLGNSHGETAVDPKVLDSKLNTVSYNACRRIMPVKDIWYLMREVCWNNQPKTILYEVDPYYWSVPGISLGNDTSVFFAGNDPENRLDYFLHEMLTQPFANVIADYRFAPRNASQIPGTARVKLTSAYIRRREECIPMIMKALHLGNEYRYGGKGFRYGTGVSEYMNAQYKPAKFRAGKVVAENVKYFEKMAAFCRQKKIRLVCFYSALPPRRLRDENVNDVHDYFTKLCEKEDVEYYDMNYLKKGYLDRTDEDYVDMDGHMMGPLARRQTVVLARILTSEDTDAFFENDYRKVLADLPEETEKAEETEETE